MSTFFKINKIYFNDSFLIHVEDVRLIFFFIKMSSDSIFSVFPATVFHSFVNEMVPLIISLDTFSILTSESLSLYKGTTFAYGPLVPQEFLFSGTVLSRVSFPCPSRR